MLTDQIPDRPHKSEERAGEILEDVNGHHWLISNGGTSFSWYHFVLFYLRLHQETIRLPLETSPLFSFQRRALMARSPATKSSLR
jgi:hypothetical protein